MEGIKRINELGGKKFWSSYNVLDLSKQHNSGNEKLFRKTGWNYINDQFNQINPDELIVGNLADSFVYPFLLKNGKSFDEITLLDDGTPTLDILNKRKENSFYKSYNLRSIKEMIKWVVYFKILSPIYSSPRNLKFFTLFDAPFLKSEQYHQNKYAWLKSLITTDELVNEAYFIGSNLPARNIVSESVYLNSLEKIKTELSKRNLAMKYVQHRGETQEILKKINEICPVISFDGPLELAFLNQASPILFASHFSSALFNLSRIYSKSENLAFLFPEEQLIGTAFENKNYLINLQKEFKNDSLIKTNELS